MAARGALLRYLRVNVDPTIPSPRECALPFSVLLRRFSEEVRGSFLDKSEVTDRVLTVVKKFEKVDPSKVILIRSNPFLLSFPMMNCDMYLLG